ncbi:MAG: phosphate signaling complex protein PhoU [Armatimonadota bacterium]
MDRPLSHRPAFDAQMQALEKDLLEMVSRAEAMVADSVQSVVRLDRELADKVFEADDEIDRLDYKIEQSCLELLALQQPMGRDLREIGAVLKIITDVERIGDLAVDIAKTGLKINQEGGDPSVVDLVVIADKARKMVREAVLAFVKGDLKDFGEIVELEDQVDSYYRDIREQVFTYMRAHPDHVVASVWLVLALHHIERIADHAVNIAERVGYMVTGRLEGLADGTGTEGGSESII